VGAGPLPFSQVAITSRVGVVVSISLSPHMEKARKKIGAMDVSSAYFFPFFQWFTCTWHFTIALYFRQNFGFVFVVLVVEEHANKLNWMV